MSPPTSAGAGDDPTQIDAGHGEQAAATPSDAGATGGGDLPGEFGEEICPLGAGERCGSRYRLIEKLGAGGMGEVWKARDEALGQVVALKFLGGPFLDAGGRGVELLRNEVRIARRVTHPHVCRVHDLGQVADKTFLSMEFVDGEPLDVLLRRIGRPTPQKCREIARQIAAGLHAAHEQGVLHRDLKPGNVMLDARGDVRLTDFGIAGLARDAAEKRDGSGTPAYMAPELFDEQPASVATDLWSLGALLFELYTGERYIRARDFTELRREHRQPPRVAAALPHDFEPEVEAMLRELLDPDPAARPPSALAVVSRLTGGNLLEEVLRAGRTPSPDLIAAANFNDDARGVRQVVALLALFVTALVVVFVLEPAVKLLARTPLPESGEVLQSLARRSLESLQAVPSEGDRAFGFDFHGDYVRALADADARGDLAPGTMDRRFADGDARPGPIDFWYRTAPIRKERWAARPQAMPLVADHLSGVVSWSDPPLTTPGMTRARFDARGRLLEFDLVPPELATALSPGEAGAPVFPAGAVRVVDGRDALSPEQIAARVFAAAGLDPVRFAPTAPLLVPLHHVESSRAFCDDRGLRVEIGSAAGHLVSVRVYEEEWRELAAHTPMRWRPGMSGPLGVLRGLTLVVAVVLAGRVLRRRRADVRGAVRLGIGVFGLVLLVTLLTGNHSSQLGAEGTLWMRGMARGLLVAAQYVIFYLALESHVRRIWPRTMIAWTRLLRGRFGDPAVGFSLLAGAAFGVFGGVLLYVGRLLPAWLDGAAVRPLMLRSRSIEVLSGPTQAVGAVLEIVVYYADISMALVLGLVSLRYLLRSAWAAGIVMVLLLTAGWTVSYQSAAVSQILLLTGVSTVLVVLATRVGLLGLIAAFTAFRIVAAFPFRTDLDHWLGRATLFAVALLIGLAAFGAWRSLRDERLVRQVRATSRLAGPTPGP